MSVTVTVNGSTHTIPQTGETNWGSAVTAWIQAVSSATLQKSGGTFTLTAEADFGSNYGIKALYYKSRTANVADSGQIRLANADTIAFRNAANSGNLLLTPGASDGLLNYNSVALVTVSASQTLTGKTLTAPVISTISNTGTLTLPTSTDTLVGRATTDTLTNKTLTSPTISGPTISGTLAGATATFSGTLSATGTTLVGTATSAGSFSSATYTATPTFSVGSTTDGAESAIGLYSQEGINNRRAKLFLDDTSGVFGLWASAGSGIPSFALGFGGNAAAFTVSNTGAAAFTGTLGVTGAATFSSTMGITGALTANNHVLGGTTTNPTFTANSSSATNTNFDIDAVNAGGGVATIRFGRSSTVGTGFAWYSGTSTAIAALSSTGALTLLDSATLTKTTNGTTQFTVTNSDPGSNAQGRFSISNGTSNFIVEHNGTGMSTSAYNIANSGTLRSNGVGGLSIAATDAAGVIRFYTGGSTLRGTIDASGNLGLGTATFGTSAAKVLGLFNGTAPSTGPADTVQVYSTDLSAGNTIPSVFTEGTGITGAAITSTAVTTKIAIRVNGTVYYLLATTSAS
jgi:hypothetical protein